MGCHLPDKLLHPNWFLKIASAKLEGNEFFNKAAELLVEWVPGHFRDSLT